jgi:hypothetical protein
LVCSSPAETEDARFELFPAPRMEDGAGVVTEEQHDVLFGAEFEYDTA